MFKGLLFSGLSLIVLIVLNVNLSHELFLLATGVSVRILFALISWIEK